MRSQSGEIASAIQWVIEPTNPATRGHRAVAFAITLLGPSAVDGLTTVRDVAEARGVPEATMWAYMKTLRARFGMRPPIIARIAHETPDFRPTTRGVETDTTEEPLDDSHLESFFKEM